MNRKLQIKLVNYIYLKWPHFPGQVYIKIHLLIYFTNILTVNYTKKI